MYSYILSINTRPYDYYYIQCLFLHLAILSVNRCNRTGKLFSIIIGPYAYCVSTEFITIGTCESEIFVRIESRIESTFPIRIRIESRIESGIVVYVLHYYLLYYFKTYGLKLSALETNLKVNIWLQPTISYIACKPIQTSCYHEVGLIILHLMLHLHVLQ